MALPSVDYSVAKVIPSVNGPVFNPFLTVDLSKQPQTWWDDANTTDGTKGRAAKDSNGSELAITWIEFNKTNQTGKLRILWTGPIVNGETIVRVYAPNTRNESVSSTDTFGSNACMNGANVRLYSPNGGNDDRSSNAFTLTENGGVVSGDSAGQLGDATEFDGTNQYLNTAITDQDQPLTFMAWSNSDTSKNQTLVIMNGNPLFDHSISMDKLTDGRMSAAIVDPVGTSNLQGLTFSTGNNVWLHSAAVFNETAVQNVDIFLNGVLDNSVSSGPTRNPTIDEIRIGASFDFFDGKMQEVLVFNDAKTVDWINFEFIQIKDNASFWSPWVFGTTSAKDITGKRIVQGSLRLLKVKESGEELTADELVDGIEALNDLICYWNIQEWMQATKANIEHAMTAGQSEYTIGIGGDISKPWPLKIKYAHVIDEGLAYELQIIDVGQYENIFNKPNGSTYPAFLYYERSFPLGTVKVWPKPSKNSTLRLTVYDQLDLVTDPDAVIDLPPSYTRALRYNLATELVSEYDPPKTYAITERKADQSLIALKDMNSSPVPRQRFESSYVTGTGYFDIRSGRIF